MHSLLTNTDYTNILRFYKTKIPRSKSEIRKSAEKIISKKLCKCIKKIDTSEGPRAIGICTKTIFNSKGFKRGKFTCKNKGSVYFLKKDQSNLVNKNRTKSNKNVKTRKHKK